MTLDLSSSAGVVALVGFLVVLLAAVVALLNSTLQRQTVRDLKEANESKSTLIQALRDDLEAEKTERKEEVAKRDAKITVLEARERTLTDQVGTLQDVVTSRDAIEKLSVDLRAYQEEQVQKAEARYDALGDLLGRIDANVAVLIGRPG